jgi:hypothetical protein
MPAGVSQKLNVDYLINTILMKKKLILIALTTVLSACGGGGGGNDAPAATPTVDAPSTTVAPNGGINLQKYVGSWTTGCIAEGLQSGRINLQVNAPNGMTSTATVNPTGYEFAACAGRSVTNSLPVTINYIGPAQGGADTVELVEGSEKTLVTLYLSADGKTLSVNDEGEVTDFIKQ